MKSSELILNPDGSVYHLALKPGEVSNTIITVGDPERVAKVSDRFDSIELKKEKREFVTHTGFLGGKRLTVISTGIGTDNVDIVFNELHALKTLAGEEASGYKLIRLGTSGAVRPDQNIDTVLISSAALGLDGIMHFYKWNEAEQAVVEMIDKFPDWKNLPKPYAALGSDLLIEKFSSIADTIGVTVTAPGFYAPQGRSVNAPAKVPGFVELLGSTTFQGKPITNIEMETAGIYGLASLLNHQAISISSILANRSTGEFSQNPEAIVEKMIDNALEIMVNDQVF